MELFDENNYEACIPLQNRFNELFDRKSIKDGAKNNNFDPQDEKDVSTLLEEALMSDKFLECAFSSNKPMSNDEYYIYANILE